MFSATLNTAMSFSERMSYGLSVFVVGLSTVFAVLAILWLALVLFKVFTYDIPQKRAKKAEESKKVDSPAPIEEVAAEPSIETNDDEQLIAVISAAIAAYTAQSGNALPFRVVSYKRVNNAGGWARNK